MSRNGVCSSSAEDLIDLIEQILTHSERQKFNEMGWVVALTEDEENKIRVERALGTIQGWKTFRGVDEVMKELEMDQVEGPAMRARDV